MSATNQTALSILACKVYIAPWASITALQDSLSNASTIIAQLDALSYSQLASVTDVEFAINTADKAMKIETDDNGIIYQAYTPMVKVTWNWFETGDVNSISALIWANVQTSGTGRIYGQNITAKSLPHLVVKIVWVADSAWLSNTIYLYDAWMSWDIIQSYVDVVRAGNIKPSPFTFEWNKWWIWLVNAKRF